jgi:hypothetical protein
MRRMAEIEVEMANLGNTWAGAAANEKRLDRQRKKREAQLLIAKGPKGAREGGSSDAFKKAQVEDEIWAEVLPETGEFLMANLTEAEAGTAGGTAMFKTLDRELSSLQTRLQALLKMDSAPSFQGQTGVGHD